MSGLECFTIIFFAMLFGICYGIIRMVAEKASFPKTEQTIIRLSVALLATAIGILVFIKPEYLPNDPVQHMAFFWWLVVLLGYLAGISHLKDPDIMFVPNP